MRFLKAILLFSLIGGTAYGVKQVETADIANLAVTGAKIANSAVNLATKVTGTLPVGNGGTGATSFTDKSVLFAGSSAVSEDNTHFLYDSVNTKLTLKAGSSNIDQLCVKSSGNHTFCWGTTTTGSGQLFLEQGPNVYDLYYAGWHSFGVGGTAPKYAFDFNQTASSTSFSDIVYNSGSYNLSAIALRNLSNTANTHSEIVFSGGNSTQEPDVQLVAKHEVTTAGSETGSFYIRTRNAGTTATRLTIAADGTMTSTGKVYGAGLDAGSAAITNVADPSSAQDAATKNYVDTHTGASYASQKAVTQSSHGLSVGNLVYTTGSTYAKAKADADSTSEVVGIVSAVADSNNFTLTLGGYVSGLSGLTAGTTYYLSDSSAGALTATEPSTAGYISKPVLVADSTTSGYFVNMRGVTIAAAVTSGPRSEVWVYGANGYGGGSSNKIFRYSTVGKNTGNAITYTDDSTNGAYFTINETGVYAITACRASGGNETYLVTLNDNQLTTAPSSVTRANILQGFVTLTANLTSCIPISGVNLSSGDVIRVHGDSAAAGSATASDSFRITKVSN